jgi:hypothetical protein
VALAARPLARPTALQVQLLRAAVLPAPEALTAWGKWQSVARVDELESESQWLLPLLYCNLRQAGVSETRLLRYGNVFRHNWYKNHLLLRATRPAVAALRAAGNVALVLRGAAMAAMHYPTLGARPIESVALHAPDVDLVTTARALAATAWRPDHLADADEGVVFTDSLGRRLRLEPAVFGGPMDRDLSETARVAQLPGMTLDVLGTAEQLVHILVRRDTWDPRSALLWAADAAQILRRLSEGERRAVWRFARHLGVEDCAAEALRQLREDFGLPAAHVLSAHRYGA